MRPVTEKEYKKRLKYTFKKKDIEAMLLDESKKLAKDILLSLTLKPENE